MVLMQYDRLAVSLRLFMYLSLASCMLRMKLLVLKYLIIHVVFFFQMFDCVWGCIFFISSIICYSTCLLEFALYVPFFFYVLVHNWITPLIMFHSSCFYSITSFSPCGFRHVVARMQLCLAFFMLYSSCIYFIAHFLCVFFSNVWLHTCNFVGHASCAAHRQCQA